MAVAKNWADRGGCVPGNDHAIPQRKAINEGYVAAHAKSPVKLNQPTHTTGCTHVPGWTHKRKDCP